MNRPGERRDWWLVTRGWGSEHVDPIAQSPVTQLFLGAVDRYWETIAWMGDNNRISI